MLLSDRGHDSDGIRQDARDCGGRLEIPTERNRRIQRNVEWPIYALRDRIERCINRLKRHRRVAARYDETASSFLGFVQLAAVRSRPNPVHAA